MDTVIGVAAEGANPLVVHDIINPKTDVELKTMWEKDITRSTNFELRDSLLEVMLRRGVRPDTWIHNRDNMYGLYPDADDPDFASRLFRKTEFAQLRSVAVDEDTCTQSQTVFDTTPVQRLVSRFLHPMTPYLGLLLNHGVGVGKTCSAITVAETFLEVSPNNTVYILCPKAIADGFKRTIFDANKLVRVPKEETLTTGEAWRSVQCTGMTYPRLVGMADNTNREEIAKEVEKLVKKRYKIVGYLAFANWVKSKLDAIPAVITGVARKDKEKQILMELFSDHLIIIDEAHNLRDEGSVETEDEPDIAKITDAAEGKRLTPILRSIVEVAEGMRLMLMTATPMYNTAPEIIFLLNLLTLNDTKDEKRLLSRSDIFKADGQFTDKGEGSLTKIVRRYVSYMRGENPNTFPLRLNPPESAGAAFMDAYPEYSISRKEDTTKLTATDIKIMEQLPLIVHNADDTYTGRKLLGMLTEHHKPSDDGGAVEVSDFILDQTMQVGNISYPNETYGTKGWEANTKEEFTTASGHKIKQFSWANKEHTVDAVLGMEGLKQYAPKMAAIVESLQRAQGIQFVYSRYVKAGALPICMALELQGWCRVLADGTPAPLLKRPAGAPAPKHFYILLTSEDNLSPNFKGLLQYATTFSNDDEARLGTKVKAIIGSQVASEGLDLKCIREIHLLDGWYHLNRIEQIEGRGVRFCSHVALPVELRNTLIYLHAITLSKYETADLYAYRLAVRKAQPIGRVSRLMKINAWDCMLNKDAILLADMPTRAITDARGRTEGAYDVKDKPFTSFCDFSDQCEYICGSKPIPGSNNSTYTETDFRRLFLSKQERLQEIFKTETAFPLEDIRTMVYDDMPWSIGAIGLREVLGKLKIKRDDGIYGTLILLNNHIVFQPDQVTDTQIPLAYRYGRAYGRLPRTFTPQRQSVMETDAPVEAPTEGEEHRVEATGESEDALRDSAFESLRMWRALLQRIISEPAAKLKAPAGFSKESFNGWWWLFHHFRTLEETVPIACQWWMDNIWSWKQRAAVLRDWTIRGISTLKDDEAMYARLFQPRELFTGELSGYVVYNTDIPALQTYCYSPADKDPPSICTTSLQPDVNAAIGAPINRKSDSVGTVFGFIVYKKGTVVFKTVDKVSGNPEGAECANTSNLKNHEGRIKIIQDIIRRTPPVTGIIPLLLADTPETVPTDDQRKARQDSVKRRFDLAKADVYNPETDLQHTSDLSLKQICPYMEFLLRWMQMRGIGKKNWFLSVAESSRAGVKFA